MPEFKSDFLKAIDRLDLKTEDSIELFFMLKAWKIVSSLDYIDEYLKFDYFFENMIEAKHLQGIFKALSKDFKVFKLYLKEAHYLKKVDNITLELLYYFINCDLIIDIKVNDIFHYKNSSYHHIVSYQIAELGIRLALSDDCSKPIYTPFTNGFSCSYASSNKIIAESTYEYSAFIAELMSVVENKDIEFILNDAIKKPSLKEYGSSSLLRQFDAVISFPPLGRDERRDLNSKFILTRRDKNITIDIAYFLHVLSHTSKKAVIMMPVGLSYRTGAESEFREYLVKKNLLEALIQLPPNFHSGTSLETTLFVINRDKKTDKTLFINLKGDRFLIRDSKKMIFKDIYDIVDIYETHQEIENVSALISNKEIEMFNYSLSIERYVMNKKLKELKDTLHSHELVKLKDIAQIRRSQLFSEKDGGQSVYELSPSDFSRAGFTKEGLKTKNIDTKSNKYNIYKLMPYDILLSAKGTIGKVAIISEEFQKPLIASQASEIIRLNNKKDAIVVYMFLKSNIGQALLKQLTSGSAMPQIASSDIKGFLVPVFSEEQKKKMVSSFYKEIELYGEIDRLEGEIRGVHEKILFFLN